jgi:hypothetical protein
VSATWHLAPGTWHLAPCTVHPRDRLYRQISKDLNLTEFFPMVIKLWGGQNKDIL